MHDTRAIPPDARLTLQSRLAELTLVWPWIQSLARQYSLPANTQFAIDLCLEEAVSNVIRHGYAGDPDHTVTIDCIPHQDWLNFIVEDSAPPFPQIQAPDSIQGDQTLSSQAVPASVEDLKAGGHGIHLIRQFAGSVAWQQLPNGNRLTLGFRIAQPTLS